MNYQLPDAIFFDLDDTILASTTLAGQIWCTVSKKFAERLETHDSKQLFDAIEIERTLYWSDPERHRRGRLNPSLSAKEVALWALARLGADDVGMASEMGEAYQTRRDEQIHPFPGAKELLSTLMERGVKLALITNGNGRLQWSKITKFGLEYYFDCIVIEEQFGFGKPDRRVYRHAMGHLGSLPEHTWMIGDNLEWEVAVPKQLGNKGIWVDNHGSGLPANLDVQPDKIIRGLSELLEDLNNYS